jgi:drug/metabolite transporter (DMT)-like permease
MSAIAADQALIHVDGDKDAMADAATPGEGKPSALLISVLVVIFVASGVAQPLLSSQNKYMGLANATAQLYMVPYFAGMASVGFLYFCIPSRRWFHYKVHKSLGIAMVDLIGQILNYTGNNMAGSGIFSVIYASVSIWCAVLSWVFGLRKVHLWQWLAIFLVFGGLVVSAVGSVQGGRQVTIGAGLLVIGSFLHAVMYCLSEFVSVRGGPDEKIPPHINCGTMATTEVLVLTIWQFIYTIPHWDETIEQPMEKEGTTVAGVCIIFAAIGFANFVHSASFFYLLKHLGAVSAAVMKGLQAVLVFVMADIIFCGAHKHQCIDSYKVVSLVIVVGGVLAYAAVTSKLSAQSSA